MGVVTLSEAGPSQRQVAQQLRVNQSTVSRILRRFRETGSNRRRHGQGRPRATFERDERFLRLTVLRDRFQTSVQLQHRLREVRHVPISERTVRRRQNERGVRITRFAIDPLLIREHRVAISFFTNV